jgi:transposase InsO family protein
MDADFCVTALEEAIARFGKPDIFNTDQGSQFTSFAFTNTLKERRHPYLDGWPWPMDGQGLHRTAVAIAEIRMCVPERL